MSSPVNDLMVRVVGLLAPTGLEVLTKNPTKTPTDRYVIVTPDGPIAAATTYSWVHNRQVATFRTKVAAGTVTGVMEAADLVSAALAGQPSTPGGFPIVQLGASNVYDESTKASQDRRFSTDLFWKTTLTRRTT